MKKEYAHNSGNYIRHFNTMHKLFIITFLFYLTACTGQSNKSSTQDTTQPIAYAEYKWTQLTANAAFSKAYNFQIFSIRDTLWVMHHAGIWIMRR